MYLNILITLLQLNVIVAATPNCKSNRPKNYKLQSVVCCDPSWEFNHLQFQPSTGYVNIEDIIMRFGKIQPTEGWLVDITNFQRVQLKISTLPVALRWPVPVYGKG